MSEQGIDAAKSAETYRMPSDTWATELSRAGQIRPEVFAAWQNLQRAVRKAQAYLNRSRRSDMARTKPYWSTTVELGSRAFEAYVVQRLRERADISNDFLAAPNTDSGLYPSAQEMAEAGLGEAFDGLFNSMKTERTDFGVILYSAGRDATVASYLNDNDIPTEKQEDAGQEVRKILDAARDSGVNDERSIAARRYQGLVEGDVETIKGAFAESDSISSLIEKHLNGEIPAFNIKGAMIPDAKAFAAANLAFRTPFVETVKIAVLNESNTVVHSQILNIGSLNESVFNKALISKIIFDARSANPGVVLKGFLIAHNHPTGDVEPSRADVQLTRALDRISEKGLFEIPFLDHVITNGRGYYSFAESGLMAKERLRESDREEVFSHLADWEAISTQARKSMESPEVIRALLPAIETADPNHDHVFYLDNRLKLIAVERIPSDLSDEKKALRVAQGSSRMGARGCCIPRRSTDVDSFRISHFGECFHGTFQRLDHH